MKRKFKPWGYVFLWAAVIFLFSSIPTKEVTEIYWWDFAIKKSAHVAEFGVFAALFYRASTESGAKKKPSGFLAIASSFFYGISDEFHQSFTPGRGPAARDVIFDTIGAALAIYLIWNYLPKAPKKLKALAKNWRLI